VAADGRLGALGQLCRVVAKNETVVLGFDGLYNNDSTALVGCTPRWARARRRGA
jgi:hypothetical protein